MALNTIMSKLITEQNMWKNIKILYFCQLIFFSAVFLLGSFHNYIVVATIAVMNISMSISYLINFSKIYTFG